MDTQGFYRTVRERLGQCDREETKHGTAAVFHALRDRLTPDEADQVAKDLKEVWSSSSRAGDRATAIRTRATEFLRLARPRVGRFAVPESVAAG